MNELNSEHIPSFALARLFRFLVHHEVKLKTYIAVIISTIKESKLRSIHKTKTRQKLKLSQTFDRLRSRYVLYNVDIQYYQTY